MNRQNGYKTFNDYLTDQQIYDFVSRFKSGEVNSQDFDNRKCDNRLAVFKAFRYGLENNGVNFYSYVKPEHQENSTYKANFEALEYAHQNMTNAFLKCRTYINRMKRLVECKCVDPSRPTNNVSELPTDVYYFSELLLALHSRSAFLQADTTRDMIQKKMVFAKKNLAKNVAFFYTLNNSNKELRREDSILKINNIRTEADEFLQNLNVYAKNLGVVNDFLVENRLDSMADLNDMAEECFEVSAQMFELRGPKTKVKAVSSAHKDSVDVDYHTVWGYDNLKFPVHNKTFKELRPHHRPIGYYTEDGQQYVQGSLTQKSLASMEEVPFI